jgi:hypothetical protein
MKDMEIQLLKDLIKQIAEMEGKEVEKEDIEMEEVKGEKKEDILEEMMEEEPKEEEYPDEEEEEKKLPILNHFKPKAKVKVMKAEIKTKGKKKRGK